MSEQEQKLREMAVTLTAQQAVLSSDHYAAVLRLMLDGKRVKAADAQVIARVLVGAATDLQWPAKRYAEGRMTYVVGMVNDATRSLIALGLSITPTDGNVYAADGMYGLPAYATRPAPAEAEAGA